MCVCIVSDARIFAISKKYNGSSKIILLDDVGVDTTRWGKENVNNQNKKDVHRVTNPHIPISRGAGQVLAID